MVHVFDIWQHGRYNLDSTRTATNNRDSFVFIVECVVPSRRMHDRALEILQARKFRELPLVQITSCLDQNIGIVLEFLYS